MKKKICLAIAVILLLLTMVGVLAACMDHDHVGTREDQAKPDEHYWYLISVDDFCTDGLGRVELWTVCDINTKIMYTIAVTSNGIDIQMLYKTDGSPLTYSGSIKK